MRKSLDGTVKRRDGRIDLHFERHAGEPIPPFQEPDFFAMREKYAEFIGPIESIE